MQIQCNPTGSPNLSICTFVVGYKKSKNLYQTKMIAQIAWWNIQDLTVRISDIKLFKSFKITADLL